MSKQGKIQIPSMLITREEEVFLKKLAVALRRERPDAVRFCIDNTMAIFQSGLFDSALSKRLVEISPGEVDKEAESVDGKI